MPTEVWLALITVSGTLLGTSAGFLIARALRQSRRQEQAELYTTLTSLAVQMNQAGVTFEQVHALEAQMGRRRQERFVKVVDAAIGRRDRRGATWSEPLPDKFALPLAQGASLEDDPDLQRLWANLLDSARSDAEFQQVQYASILQALGRADAIALRAFVVGEVHHAPSRPGTLPYTPEMAMDGQAFGLEITRKLVGLGLLEPCIQLITVVTGGPPDGRVTTPLPESEIDLPGSIYWVVVTDTGRAFARAVGLEEERFFDGAPVGELRL